MSSPKVMLISGVPGVRSLTAKAFASGAVVLLFSGFSGSFRG